MLNYRKLAQGYNQLHWKEQLAKLRIIRNYYNDKISKDSLILDVGCGTLLSGNVFNSIIVGLDPFIEMIKHSKIKYKKNIMPVVGLAEYLPFKENIFDLVVSVTAIHNFSNITKSIKEMKRVAKSNIAISVMKRSNRFKEISNNIHRLLRIEKIIKEDKDLIFFLKCN